MNKVTTTIPIRLKAKDGDKGDGGVSFMLDNESDTMLYDDGGNLVSGSVTSNAHLYVGGTEITSGVTYSISASGCTATISDRKVTVTAMSATTATVTVTANYKNTAYTAVLTLKKLVSEVKYWLWTSAAAVRMDASGNLSPSTITVKIYKTDTSGTTSLVSSLTQDSTTSDRLKFGTNGTIEESNITYSGGSGTITTATFYSSAKTSNVLMLRIGDKERDRQTIPLVIDGDKGDKGDQGSTFYASPAQLVFDTNANGSLKASYLSTQLCMGVGSKEVAVDSCYTVTVCSNCSQSYADNDEGEIIVKPTNIASTTIKVMNSDGDLEDQTVYIPPTSGYVAVKITDFLYNGVKYSGEVTIPFTVNNQNSVSTMYSNDTTFLSRIGSLNPSTDGSLWSEITQLKWKAAMIVKGLDSSGNIIETGVTATNGVLALAGNKTYFTDSSGNITMTLDSSGNLVVGGNASIQGCIKATSGDIGGLEIVEEDGDIGGIKMADNPCRINNRGMFLYDSTYSRIYTIDRTPRSLSSNNDFGSYAGLLDIQQVGTHTYPLITLRSEGGSHASHVTLDTNGVMKAYAVKHHYWSSMVMPWMLGYGSVVGTSSGATITGSVMGATPTVSRSAVGVYAVSWSTSLDTYCSNYRVIPVGRNSANIKAVVRTYGTKTFTVELSDDSSANDSTFDFIILGW